MGAQDYPCLISDLETYFPAGITVTDTTTPSIAAVQLMIINIADEINGVLRDRGFVFPITNQDALSYLNTVCAYGAAARVFRTKFPSDTGPGGSKGFAEDYETKYQAMLKEIKLAKFSIDDERDYGVVGFEAPSRVFARRRTIY